MRCVLCSGTFCEDHGDLGAHKCPKASELQTGSVRCPICKVYIPVRPGQSAAALVDSHIESGCKLHARKAKKHRCAFKGCKAKLESYQRIECRDCHHRFCVAHRANHRCGDKTALRSKKDKAAKRRNEMSTSGSELFSNAMGFLRQRGIEGKQLETVKQFMALTLEQNTEDAVALLERHRWNLNRAVELYFRRQEQQSRGSFHRTNSPSICQAARVSAARA